MNNVDNKMLAFVLRVSDFGEPRWEHLDWFGGLINMNGRVYDSKLGRFLSADKVVQDAGSTQNYNSYSYCLNNPLKYSDPSGWLIAPNTYANWDYNEFARDNAARDWADEQWAFDGAGQSAGWGGMNSVYSTDYGRTIGHNYNYNWNTGKYQDGGNEVCWVEVYHNYVVPHSFWSGNGADGLNAGIHIMEVQYGCTEQSISVPFVKPNYSALGQRSTPLTLPEQIYSEDDIYMMTNADDLIKELDSYSTAYYENAQNLVDIPYHYGEMSQSGTDCSGFVQLSMGYSSRVWTTSDGDPPGGWEPISVTTSSYKSFISRVQTGDLIVWPTRHTAFYAGDGGLLHAHGDEGTPAGYTYDLEDWWIPNRGYPNVYRQRQ